MVRPALEELAAAARESVTLHTTARSDRVTVDVVNTPSPLMSMNRPGEHTLLGLGGASLILMAFLPPLELNKIMPAAAKTAKCSKKELHSILGTVRRQRYAVSHGGSDAGLSGISAPVFTADGEARYCVSIVVPTIQVRGRVSSLTSLVRTAASDISRRLGATID